MQPDTVATGRRPNVDHRMDVVSNGKADGFFYQPKEGFLKI
jgi:hypothetical protein